jgi:2,3-bisphosphoglycerate-independent phosphoglycerate mutase
MEKKMPRPKPVMLMILDGWGIDPPGPGNAVSLARTPHLDRLLTTYPHTRLQTSGKAVGLPDGVMGNSEVGHMNIGAGRVVYQDLTRIDMAIEKGTFFKNPAFLDAIGQVKEKKRALHLIGLVSDGGVHSQLTHVLALLDLAKTRGLSQVFVHAILDGRDTAPDGGQAYVAQVQAHIQQIGTGAVASVCGRYYAMDRDTRWDRTEKAYRLLTLGEGRQAYDPVEAIRQAYARGESDEFVEPIVIAGGDDRPVSVMQDGDAVIFFNFRADRARQLTRALTDPQFNGFHRPAVPLLSPYVCMTLYEESFGLPVAFPPERLEANLGETISAQGMRQLRIAETEKYAHVTYFFNGGEEKPFENEDRCLVPSPRDVPTYDYKPEMSALGVTDEVLKRIASNRYDLIVLNFANMDMVGHTGNIQAAIKACETVDRCTGRIAEAVLAGGGALLVTADHGNAETMRNTEGKMFTAHTTNPVYLILVDEQHRQFRLREGILGDIAPTILQIMRVPQPPQMTGKSLIERLV